MTCHLSKKTATDLKRESFFLTHNRNKNHFILIKIKSNLFLQCLLINFACPFVIVKVGQLGQFS